MDEDDPRFLQNAANDPSALDLAGSAISGLAAGAYSWPFDYTLCLHWMAGTAGIYGSRIQSTCNYHTQRILTILGQTARLTYYLLFRGVLAKALGTEAGQHALSSAIDGVSRSLPQLTNAGARLVGRGLTGAAFTAWMASRGRIAEAPRGRAIGVASFNFIALLWGSAVHVSAEHPRDIDIISIFACWITGDPNYTLTNEQYMAAYRAVMAAEESMIGSDREDLEAFRSVLDILVRFGRTGGEI